MKKTSKKEERIVSKIIKSSKLEELEIKKIEENLKKKEDLLKKSKKDALKQEKALAKDTSKKEEQFKVDKKEQTPKREERIIEEKLEEWQDGVFVTEFSPVTDSSPIIREDKTKGPRMKEELEESLSQVPSQEKEKKEEKIYSASTIEKGYFKDVYTDVKEKYTGRDWSEDRPMEEIRGRGARFAEISHARDGRREAGMGRRANLMEDGMLSMGRHGRDETIKYDMAISADQDEHMEGFAPEFETKYKHRKKL